MAEALRESEQYPNLIEHDILLDTHESHTFGPSKWSPYTNTVILRDEETIFKLAREAQKGEVAPMQQADTTKQNPTSVLAKKVLRVNFIRSVIHQTGKGRVMSMACTSLVGNGHGFIGIGEGTSGEGVSEARDIAINRALRRMDQVELFEGRTIWTEMDGKFGSTRIILRPRPVGFGLAVNPVVHEVCRVLGIKDLSAKVWGSRNKYQVLKATLRLLLPGSMPAMMGNGVGGKGKRLEKGVPMRTAMEMELARGRKIVPLHD
ncbi:uncharacterized protein BXZ73DRAFT_41497 [Epithele typhae]|uniref:uncharacterized protein n=1 Tax=Epithele typhae TaxID=378194 RepID=UPI0020086C0F|nr:uncharacterized protein BXZ73DRAFT_41497 [Epithele typhae]KAH9941742.1 hypothetical protein BXZ73DRAFT_41497 [Epithele typhae]